MPGLSSRTENFTDSVIRRMTRVANQYGAVNLSQSFPDFAPPKELTDRRSGQRLTRKSEELPRE